MKRKKANEPTHSVLVQREMDFPISLLGNTSLGIPALKPNFLRGSKGFLNISHSRDGCEFFAKFHETCVRQAGKSQQRPTTSSGSAKLKPSSFRARLVSRVVKAGRCSGSEFGALVSITSLASKPSWEQTIRPISAYEISLGPENCQTPPRSSSAMRMIPSTTWSRLKGEHL